MQKNCITMAISDIRGITLVELLVSVSLGLVIMASMSTVVFDSAQLTQLGMSEVQTLRQFERTMDVIEATVELAGFVPDIVYGVSKHIAYPAFDQFRASESIRLETHKKNTSTVMQFRTIGYLNSSVDCLGESIPHAMPVMMTIEHNQLHSTLECRVLKNGVETSGVLMRDVVFLAIGSTGLVLNNNRVSKFHYYEPTPNGFLIQGIVIEIIVKSDIEYYPQKKHQKIGLFLDEEVSFQSRAQYSKVRRTIAIRNAG